MDRNHLYLAPALLLLLAGCAGAPTAPAPSLEATTPGVSPQEAPPGPAGEAAVETEPAPPVMSGNRAVIALLDRAQIDSQAGRREAAGLSLERALRIEPRNPWLWHELARLRLAQGQYAQALTLARKSISFAGGERRLLALNWRLIGEAQVAQGDPASARQAFERAAGFEDPEEEGAEDGR